MFVCRYRAKQKQKELAIALAEHEKKKEPLKYLNKMLQHRLPAKDGELDDHQGAPAFKAMADMLRDPEKTKLRRSIVKAERNQSYHKHRGGGQRMLKDNAALSSWRKYFGVNAPAGTDGDGEDGQPGDASDGHDDGGQGQGQGHGQGGDGQDGDAENKPEAAKSQLVAMHGSILNLSTSTSNMQLPMASSIFNLSSGTAGGFSGGSLSASAAAQPPQNGKDLMTMLSDLHTGDRYKMSQLSTYIDLLGKESIGFWLRLPTQPSWIHALA